MLAANLKYIPGFASLQTLNIAQKLDSNIGQVIGTQV